MLNIMNMKDIPEEYKNILEDKSLGLIDDSNWTRNSFRLIQDGKLILDCDYKKLKNGIKITYITNYSNKETWQPERKTKKLTIDSELTQDVTAQERINQAKSQQENRSQKCSYTTAVDYIKSYYPEIKTSKKNLMEMLQKSDIVKFAGYGSIGFVSGTSFSGVGRTSYEMITMDSVDEFAVDLIGLK